MSVWHFSLLAFLSRPLALGFQVRLDALFLLQHTRLHAHTHTRTHARNQRNTNATLILNATQRSPTHTLSSLQSHTHTRLPRACLCPITNRPRCWPHTVLPHSRVASSSLFSLPPPSSTSPPPSPPRLASPHTKAQRHTSNSQPPSRSRARV